MYIYETKTVFNSPSPPSPIQRTLTLRSYPPSQKTLRDAYDAYFENRGWGAQGRRGEGVKREKTINFFVNST